MASHIERRKFLAALGGAAAWPLAARAQQAQGRPLIGVLSPISAALAARNMDARQGLRAATAHEQGLADFEANAWSGLFLPKGTPAAFVSKLNLAVSEAMDSKAVQDRMSELGTTLVSADRRSPEYLQLLVEREIAKWGPLIKAAGISVD